MNCPKITVLMPVYNACQFVKYSIKSLIKQSFIDFELLVIDDGSSDDTVLEIQSFKDSRIRLVKNDGNMGVAWTLNAGLDLARGEYVARMDADDICYPHRLAKQLQFMEKNPAVGVAGTWVRYFGDQPPVIDRTPLGTDVVKAFLFFDNALYHPSVILRKKLFDRFGLRYDSMYSRSEDYELWIRAAEYFPLDNLPEPLLRFRCHRGSVTSTASDMMKKQSCELLRRGMHKLEMNISDVDLLFHYSVAKGQRMESLEMLRKAEQWLERLIEQNAQVCAYRQDAFLKAVGIIWFRLCYHSAQLGISSWLVYGNSRIAAGYRPPIGAKIPFMVSILANRILRRPYGSVGHGN